MDALCKEVKVLRGRKKKLSQRVDKMQRLSETISSSSPYTRHELAKKDVPSHRTPSEAKAEPRTLTEKQPKLLSVLTIQPSRDHNRDVESGAVIEDEPVTVKRRRISSTDAGRNKRMFGALLGHLNKAKKNLREDKTSEIVQKQADIQKYVQEKLETQGNQIRSRRVREINEDTEHERKALEEMSNELNQKELKLRALQSIVLARKLSSTLRTQCKPSIKWEPVLHTVQTRKLKEEITMEAMDSARENCRSLGFDKIDELEMILDGKVTGSADGERGGVKAEVTVIDPDLAAQQPEEGELSGPSPGREDVSEDVAEGDAASGANGVLAAKKAVDENMTDEIAPVQEKEEEDDDEEEVPIVQLHDPDENADDMPLDEADDN